MNVWYLSQGIAAVEERIDRIAWKNTTLTDIRLYSNQQDTIGWLVARIETGVSLKRLLEGPRIEV